MSGRHAQLVTIQDLYNFRGNERLQLLDIGILATEVAECVASATKPVPSAGGAG
jgi:hypothetical protein